MPRGWRRNRVTAEFRLQPFQPVGERGLGQEQPLGGMGDVLFLVQGFQQQDVFVVHGNLLTGWVLKDRNYFNRKTPKKPILFFR